MSRADELSANVSSLSESATIAVSTRAKALRAAGRPVIDLGAGEPDFDTPQFIRRAAQQAIDAGATRYTAVPGILPLREAIASDANARYVGEDRVAANEVVVSTGSKQSLFNACFCLFGPGDEVLVPTPGWTSYYEIVGLSRAKSVPVHGDPARSLKVDAAALERASTPHTRGLVLNSPNNPTGAVYGADELREILQLAADCGWWVISDEIYARIAYDGTAPSVLDVAGSRERLVVVNGVAKAYAMTGWRIGWAIAPVGLANAMCALQSHTTSNAAAVSQHAALAALTRDAEADREIAAMVAQFRARRDAALGVLSGAPGLACVHPEGAFYLFLDVSAAGGDAPGSDFARRLLEEHEVAVVPGEAFGAPDWIRVSYSVPQEQVVEGVRRIRALHETLRARGSRREPVESRGAAW